MMAPTLNLWVPCCGLRHPQNSRQGGAWRPDQREGCESERLACPQRKDEPAGLNSGSARSATVSGVALWRSRMTPQVGQPGRPLCPPNACLSLHDHARHPHYQAT